MTRYEISYLSTRILLLAAGCAVALVVLKIVLAVLS